MPRAKSGVVHARRRRRLLKSAKGYRGARSKLYRSAKHTVLRAGAFAFRDRRRKKRDFRRLWITRVTAACRARGLRYSEFMAGCKKAGIGLNRKMLSEIAIADPAAFDQIAQMAKGALQKAAA